MKNLKEILKNKISESQITERLHITKDTKFMDEMNTLDDFAERFDLKLKYSHGLYILSDSSKIFKNKIVQNILMGEVPNYPWYVNNLCAEINEYLSDKNVDFRNNVQDFEVTITKVSSGSQVHINIVSKKINTYIGYVIINPETITVTWSNLYKQVSLEKLLVQALYYLITK